MNTRISYRYADKRNCRQYTAVVVAGTLTWEQIAPYLTAKNAFIPGQVGLEDLQGRFALPGGDHPWHQIGPDDIRSTNAEPTIALTAATLAERFAESVWDADWRVIPAAPSPPKEQAVTGSPREAAIVRLTHLPAAASGENEPSVPAASARGRKALSRTKKST